MRQSFSLVWTMVLVSCAVVACGKGDVDPVVDENQIRTEAPTQPTGSSTLTIADDGKTVTVGEGQDVVVALPSHEAQRASGYAWRIVATDKSFGYPATELLADVERFTWKTRGPLSLLGEHIVKMELRRASQSTGSGLPHEEPSDVPAVKTFTFTAKIVKSACPELMPPGPSFCSGGVVGTRQNPFGCTVFTCTYGCPVGEDCIED